MSVGLGMRMDGYVYIYGFMASVSLFLLSCNFSRYAIFFLFTIHTCTIISPWKITISMQAFHNVSVKIPAIPNPVTYL